MTKLGYSFEIVMILSPYEFIFKNNQFGDNNIMYSYFNSKTRQGTFYSSNIQNVRFNNELPNYIKQEYLKQIKLLKNEVGYDIIE